MPGSYEFLTEEMIFSISWIARSSVKSSLATRQRNLHRTSNNPSFIELLMLFIRSALLSPVVWQRMRICSSYSRRSLHQLTRYSCKVCVMLGAVISVKTGSPAVFSSRSSESSATTLLAGSQLQIDHALDQSTKLTL